MKNVNRYYNKICKITANAYHKELLTTLIDAVADYKIDEETVVEELLGSPQEYVEAYFSTFKTAKRKLPLISQLTSAGYVNLMIFGFGMLTGILALNAFVINEIGNLDIEFSVSFVSIFFYLVVFEVSQDYFDSWIDDKMQYIHHVVSLIAGWVALIVAYFILNGIYTGIIFEFVAGYAIISLGLLFYLPMGSRINKKIVFNNKVYLRKFTREQFVAEITPKIVIMSLILGVTGKIVLTTVVITTVILGIIYFWSISKIPEKNMIAIES